jgi:hypothetical protein
MPCELLLEGLRGISRWADYGSEPVRWSMHGETFLDNRVSDR